MSSQIERLRNTVIHLGVMVVVVNVLIFGFDIWMGWHAFLPIPLFTIVVAVLSIRRTKRTPLPEDPEHKQLVQEAMIELARIEYANGIGPDPDAVPPVVGEHQSWRESRGMLDERWWSFNDYVEHERQQRMQAEVDAEAHYYGEERLTPHR